MLLAESPYEKCHVRPNVAYASVKTFYRKADMSDWDSVFHFDTTVRVESL